MERVRAVATQRDPGKRRTAGRSWSACAGEAGIDLEPISGGGGSAADPPRRAQPGGPSPWGAGSWSIRGAAASKSPWSTTPASSGASRTGSGRCARWRRSPRRAAARISLRAWVGRQLSALTIPPPDSYPGPTAFAATGGNIEAIARLALSYMDPLKLAILPTHRLDAVIHLLNRHVDPRANRRIAPASRPRRRDPPGRAGLPALRAARPRRAHRGSERGCEGGGAAGCGGG